MFKQRVSKHAETCLLLTPLQTAKNCSLVQWQIRFSPKSESPKIRPDSHKEPKRFAQVCLVQRSTIRQVAHRIHVLAHRQRVFGSRRIRLHALRVVDIVSRLAQRRTSLGLKELASVSRSSSKEVEIRAPGYFFCSLFQ